MALFDTIRAGASGAADYEIGRSLRFNNDDSIYLDRTPSSTSNENTYTTSFWVKRSGLTLGGSNHQTIFSCATDNAQIRFHASNDTLDVLFGGSSSGHLITTQKFRDINAWYHIVVAVDTTQASSSNRVKIYVNGSQVTSFGTETYPSQNLDTGFNSTVAHNIGRSAFDSNRWLDGYLAEFNHIDGTALTPASFGETNSDTGQWVPIDTSGLTFGTNGFRLEFADNSGTTATTLGKDTSGNGNNFTPNNFSVSSGSGNDSVTDTPTNNWCTFNPLLNSSNNTLSDGNLKSVGNTSSDNGNDRASFSMKTGKWYAEFKVTGTAGIYPQIGVVHLRDADRPNNAAPQAGYSSSMLFGSLSGAYFTNGQKQINGSATSFGNSFTTNDIIGVAFDADNGAVYFSKNGTFQNSGDPTSGSSKTGALLTWTPSDTIEHYMSVANYNGSGTEANFGQQGFTHTPPTGYGALNSENLPDPSILLPNKHFGTLLYSSGSSNGTFNFTDSDAVDFFPDWQWIKCRDAGERNRVIDVVRGNQDVTTFLLPDGNDNETSSGVDGTTVSSIENGIKIVETSIGSGEIYFTNRNYVVWNWNAGNSTVTNTDGNISAQVRANTSAGFSIVGYSGNGSNGQTVGHGLGVAPDVIILKCRTAVQNWRVWHKSLATDGSKRLILDQTNASEDASFLNDTAPTSSVFTLGNADEAWNESGDTYIAYCFSEIAGYSKFGAYTGNGNSDGAFVFTGFRPAWIMVKRSSGTEDWAVWDSVRDSGSNPNGFLLRPNGSDSEGGNVGAHQIDILSNGFKLRNSDSKGNGSGSTYVYFCFAELPFKYARAR